MVAAGGIQVVALANVDTHRHTRQALVNIGIELLLNAPFYLHHTHFLLEQNPAPEVLEEFFAESENTGEEPEVNGAPAASTSARLSLVEKLEQKANTAARNRIT